MELSRSAFLAAVVALSGCATQAVQQPSVKAVAYFMKSGTSPTDRNSRALLIGRWLSESDDSDGVHRVELSRLRADGSYEMIFQGTRAGKIIERQTEIGIWGISGNIYFTIMQGYFMNGVTQPVSPTDPTYYDAYNIILLTPDTFKYSHVVEPFEFTQKKVADDYKLPESL
jgi:hypothetical protein